MPAVIPAVLVAGCLLAFLVVLLNVTAWPTVKPVLETSARRVSVLIPARNEERNIGPCLETVLAQDCVKEVLVYDDQSDDRTAAIVTGFTALDSRVQLIPAQPLPNGWTGKSFACSRLALRAGSDWLLFLDADARLLGPGAIRGMVREAESRSATFLSCWPALEMRGFAEKLLMPMLNFAVFSLCPAPLGLLRRDESLGFGHGACILVWGPDYTRVGGHAAVAAEIFEDTRLAQVWRRKGLLSLCLDGSRVVRVRMYGDVREIWFGFRKNFRAGFQTSVTFWAFLLIHTALFIAAPFTGILPAILVVSGRLLLAVRFRQPLWSAVLHPLAECFLVALGVASWWSYRKGGAGVVWKGRIYKSA